MDIRTKALHVVGQVISVNVLLWLAALICLAGLLFIAAAAYLALASIWPPAPAALVTGIGLIAVAAALSGFILWMIPSPKSEQQDMPAAASDAGQQTHREPTSAVEDYARQWAHDHADAVSAGALATGIALAVSPRLRRAVVRGAAPLAARGLDSLFKAVTRH